jgi:hypothetical protein
MEAHLTAAKIAAGAAGNGADEKTTAFDNGNLLGG